MKDTAKKGRTGYLNPLTHGVITRNPFLFLFVIDGHRQMFQEISFRAYLFGKPCSKE